ncbi:MAG: efflux RND transporter permease subunit [Lachnospiraceae bacterium]|nr:efflux RND transporter permease subunit [Lachnospiraceae bacterium]
MEKYSVRRPFTVLVAVLIVTILGYVSVTSMSTDLLPPISLPYMIVITPYPGASAERVETLVAEPLERALGTVSHVTNVYSVCADNYCMTQLEFEDGIDMDSTMVKVSGAVTQVSATLPEEVGTSSILELSMDMLATMYIAVSREGYDIYEMSNFAEQTIRPYLERQEGVASVSAVGLVQKSVQIDLNEAKIADINRRIRNDMEETLDEAGERLQEALDEVEQGQQTLAWQERNFGAQVADGVFGRLDQPMEDARARIDEEIVRALNALDALEIAADDAFSEENRNEARRRLEESLAMLRAAAAGDFAAIMEVTTQLRIATEQVNALMTRLESRAEEMPTYTEQIGNVRSAINALSSRLDEVPALVDGIENTVSLVTQGQLDAAVAFSRAGTELTNLQRTLANAQAQYETARSQALDAASVDALVNVQNLAQIIYAQNFSMPAGYIDDADDGSILLKVGEEYATPEEIADTVLIDEETFGVIRISDIADVTVIDNADEGYASLNGENGVVLAIFKSSASGTNEVSRGCKEALARFEEDNPGTHVVVLMDQGSYIDIIVEDILRSMLLGALLAIVVLALFLHDVRPTVMVAISIPLSVLFTLVLMYFSDISLNMMTLSGLSLGIGMLVDNSIVVMENIIRLRQRGVSAGNASVQGTKQVAGAILASTLTTICVFVPMLFTTGLVRSLLIPMALSITYCLTASLIVAMTVIPASASAIMRSVRPKKDNVFEKILDTYEKTLTWCLGKKALTLGAAVLLLVLCIVTLLRMGIIMIPEIASEEIQATIRTPEEMTREESYAAADEMMEAVLRVEGVADVGIMDAGSTTGLISSFSTSSSGYGRYLCYVTVEEGISGQRISQIREEIARITEPLDASIQVESSGMGDISAFTESGLSIEVYGIEMDRLRETAQRTADAVRAVEGFTDVSDGTENTEEALLLSIDRDKAMSYGLTVAQIYGQIAQHMVTEANATTIEEDGLTLNVIVHSGHDLVNSENLLDMEFEETSLTDAAQAYGMGGASGAGGMDLDLDALTAAAQDAEEEEEEAEEEEEEESTIHRLGEFATLTRTTTPGSINRKNQVRYLTVSASTAQGYNTTLLSRELEGTLAEINASLPNGYSAEIEGETLQVREMIDQMSKMLLLAFAFIYLVMVAQFQSLLSPFIILFTIPLAFTGGMLGLLVSGEQLSLLSLMGFLVLMGTVVNNGIVFVDYTNQLRIGGLARHDALVATGRTRMRPILMTAMTTILAMSQMIFGSGMGAQLAKGMAIVIAGGLIYATLMTLYIIPVMYDILYKKQPLNVRVDDDLDMLPDDAAEYLAEKRKREENLEFVEGFDQKNGEKKGEEEP